MHREFARGVCVGAVLMAVAVFIMGPRNPRGWTGVSAKYRRELAAAAATRNERPSEHCSWEAPRIEDPGENPLWEIFQARDKGRLVRKWTPYFDVYHRYFQKYRGRKFNFLEIGIQSGGSIELWRDYFGPGITMYGLDINVYTRELFSDPPRVNIFIADQSDRDWWFSFRKQMRKNNVKFDIILDDGGHQSQQQIVTFQEAWPLLEDGGVYICEDTSTSMDHVQPYDYRYPELITSVGTPTDKLYGGGYGNPNTWISYAKSFADIVNGHYVNKTMHPDFDPYKRTKNMLSAAFYDQMVVLEKGEHGLAKGVRAGNVDIPVVARLKDGEVDPVFVEKYKKKLAQALAT